MIAAGGTAGHVVPALAVAGALRAEGAEVTFIGGERAESELVPAAGYPLRKISVEGMSRSNPLRALRALVRACGAFGHARSLLRELTPDAVLGAGGYVSGPVGLAAVTLRIPLVLSEADSHLGLTNRLLARVARRVCLAFPVAGREGGGRYRVTGRPVPLAQEDRTGARERLGIGRARSACSYSAARSALVRSTRPRCSVTVAAVRARSSRARRSACCTSVVVATTPSCPRASFPPGYDLRDYLEEAEFADALAAADLVVARAGGSVFEIAAHGTPAILVPYPHASADHQTANARWMTDAGAAIVIPDRELNGTRLAREVAALLADQSAWRRWRAPLRAWPGRTPPGR